jgi:hypothetical protein
MLAFSKPGPRGRPGSRMLTVHVEWRTVRVHRVNAAAMAIVRFPPSAAGKCTAFKARSRRNASNSPEPALWVTQPKQWESSSRGIDVPDWAHTDKSLAHNSKTHAGCRLYQTLCFSRVTVAPEPYARRGRAKRFEPFRTSRD